MVTGTLLRLPGQKPEPPEPKKLRAGYGVCDSKGHHGVVWVTHPREIVRGELHGRCARCAGASRV